MKNNYIKNELFRTVFENFSNEDALVLAAVEH